MELRRLLVRSAFRDIPHYCQRNKIARTFGHVATCDDLAARTCALQIAEYLVILRLVLDWPELRLRITATRYLRSSGISDDLFAHRVIEAVVNIEPLDDRTNLRSEEHTSELQSLMRISYAVFCLKKKNKH